MLRELGCKDCEKITGGDCGRHGPRIYPVSFAQPGSQTLPVPKPNPTTTAAEWAEKCDLEEHGMLVGDSRVKMCCDCADAYARQQVGAFRERAKEVLLSKPMGRQALWVAHDAVNAIAAAIRALEP